MRGLTTRYFPSDMYCTTMTRTNNGKVRCSRRQAVSQVTKKAVSVSAVLSDSRCEQTARLHRCSAREQLITRRSNGVG